MAKCLIFPFGGETKWIDFSLRDYPEIDCVILLGNEPRAIPQKKGKDEPINFLQKLNEYITKKCDEEQIFPVNKRKNYVQVSVPNFTFFAEILNYFRALIQQLRDRGITEIYSHLDSGLNTWRFAIYQCAEEFNEIQWHLFNYDKMTGEKDDIFVFRPLNETEKHILKILATQDVISLGKLQEIYSANYEEKTLSQILKMVDRLAKNGLIEQFKEGRTKNVKLSFLGMKMQNLVDYEKVIIPQLETLPLISKAEDNAGISVDNKRDNHKENSNPKPKTKSIPKSKLSSAKSLKCPNCSKKFRDESALNQHRKTVNH